LGGCEPLRRSTHQTDALRWAEEQRVINAEAC
jgi:hypothetical protein